MDVTLNSLPKHSRGCYILVTELKKNIRLTAGRLPSKLFLPGTYLYVGRAKNTLPGRLKRHFQKKKKLFWHIDYFLQQAEIKEIWIKNSYFDECQIVQSIKEIASSSSFPLKKFGASDCHCPSHLIYLPKKVSKLSPLRKKLSCQRINTDGNKI
ncbi:MAG: DUF123 domain-containing protein [Candidatus Aminicenantales bacterium]